MRRLCLLVLAALAVAAPAHAATLKISTQDFSPRRTSLSVSAQLTVPRQVGVRLARQDGRLAGWLLSPTRETAVSLDWDGRIAGRRVPDGGYLVQLVFGSHVLASQPLRIDTHAPKLGGLRVANGSTPFAGDNSLLTTVSPNGDGFRDVANVRFNLREAATVTMEVTRTVKAPHSLITVIERFGRGRHVLTWAPSYNVNPRTYLLRLTAVDPAGNRIVYGAPNAFVGRYPRAPVVRIQGIDAGFTRPSYAPGQLAIIHVATDEQRMAYQVFHAGPEKLITYADNQLAGLPIDTPPGSLDWSRWRNRPHPISIRVPDVPSGLYFVQFGGTDGRLGYAPFVVRPAMLGASGRILVILPTNTWQAYNFQDVDGNGYGDTWYAGPPNGGVDLGRTYIARGVPPRYYRYDLPFLHWLYWSGKNAEFISDSDFDLIRSGDQLAAAYDLVVFEGHEEYVTRHEYDVVERFRNLGGNLMFLSANNFFWHVERKGRVLRKIGEWRESGRPEAGLIGVEYRANDNGQHRGSFVVQNSAATPWLWGGTGLTDGSPFGAVVGGFGIEIDATAPESPPGTTVVAQIPDLLGPGKTAQMAYYELQNGAKVFAAGALNFCGSATFWPMKQILNNLWARLSQP